jgi:hypothetical protein
MKKGKGEARYGQPPVKAEAKMGGIVTDVHDEYSIALPLLEAPYLPTSPTESPYAFVSPR